MLGDFLGGLWATFSQKHLVALEASLLIDKIVINYE
jgi:hypothetical protein